MPLIPVSTWYTPGEITPLPARATLVRTVYRHWTSRASESRDLYIKLLRACTGGRAGSARATAVHGGTSPLHPLGGASPLHPARCSPIECRVCRVILDAAPWGHDLGLLVQPLEDDVPCVVIGIALIADARGGCRTSAARRLGRAQLLAPLHNGDGTGKGSKRQARDAWRGQGRRDWGRACTTFVVCAVRCDVATVARNMLSDAEEPEGGNVAQNASADAVGSGSAPPRRRV